MIVGGPAEGWIKSPNSERSTAISLLSHVGAVKLGPTRRASHPPLWKEQTGRSHWFPSLSPIPLLASFYPRPTLLRPSTEIVPTSASWFLRYRAELTRKCLLSRGEGRRATARRRITPRENARARIRGTLGRTRNFAGRHDSISPRARSEFPEVA